VTGSNWPSVGDPNQECGFSAAREHKDADISSTELHGKWPSGEPSATYDGPLEFRTMRLRRRLRALVLIGMLVIVASSATALPLTPFRHEAQAHLHCPGDTVVWLDFRKEVYYFKRQKRYRQGSTGSFVCQKEARASGFRRSLLGVR
jgi:hypothetical protein